MGLVHGLFLLILGGLGASSLVARREEGRKVLAALEPYQGWIGLGSVVWGAWRLFELLIGARPYRWLLGLLDAGLLICLGLLLGVGVIQGFLKNPDGRATFDGLVAKLTPYRQTLGLVAIALGAFLILSSLF